MSSGLSLGLKAKYSFYSALVFFLVANPETYKITQMVFGSMFSTSNGGCPTPLGLLLHTIVFSEDFYLTALFGRGSPDALIGG
jgi:hypothetical protein